MLRYILLFFLTLPFVATDTHAIGTTFELISLIIIFTSLFMIIGMFPINMINKNLIDRLNDGEMILAIGIPALISSIIQWIILINGLLSIRQFLTITFFFNSGLYFAVYFFIRTKKLIEHPPEPDYYHRY